MYQQYSNAIRTEYDWLPLDQYRTGRSKVLQSFLQRPSLYFTPAMVAEFEQRARINLQSELQELTHH
jgi:predicted metal-dependent HD superfamily phosphohydrolase